MRLSTYKSERHHGYIKRGDLIAFGGTGMFSRVIKFFTRSPVSHVGVVMDVVEHGRILVMESTTLNGFKGVQINRLSTRVEQYKGHVWHFALSDKAREAMDFHMFWKFLWAQDGKKYDMKQVLKTGLGLHTRESYKRMFCSELVAGAYKKCGIIDGVIHGVIHRVNPSEMTPKDVCKLRIYKTPYTQIKMHRGEPREAIK